MNFNTLHDYCTKWKLTVNTNKTKIMSFHNDRLPAGLRFFYYNGTEDKIALQFTYLGVAFTSGSSFS